MKIEDFNIPELKLITLNTFKDSRGFFTERYNQSLFKRNNLPTNWVQDNFSLSKPNVVRGLHFQHDQPQAKLISCTSGSIFDVAVDIRKDAPTFGQYISVELHGDKPQLFLIPSGFAHGFCVLGNKPACVTYKVDCYYNAQGENGIFWDDPQLNISWPVKSPIISDKDKNLNSFESYKAAPYFNY